MKIESIEDLLKFIGTNYERISNANYVDLLRETLGVYVHSKPGDKQTALNEIQEFNEYLKTFSNNQELPLFIENE
jgi:hypothetical protein